MKILLTGGAGYIGSHTALSLIDAGHELHIIDNLSTGDIRLIPKKAHFTECNINNESAYNLENSNLNGKVFKIIFLDPPFKDKQIKDLINQIRKIKIADKNSLLIIHRNRKSDDKISEYLNILEHKNYGLSKIFFCSLF